MRRICVDEVGNQYLTRDRKQYFQKKMDKNFLVKCTSKDNHTA